MTLLRKEQDVNDDSADYKDEDRPLNDLDPYFFSHRSVSLFAEPCNSALSFA